MPVLSGNQSNSPTVQDIAKQLKSNPAFYNILGGAASPMASVIASFSLSASPGGSAQPVTMVISKFAQPKWKLGDWK